MYVGRIVSVGLTKENRVAIMYRISSRSFPNRIIEKKDKSLVVLPKKGFEDDLYKNPYIAYTCLRYNDQCAIAGNGSHTDPIFEKISSGMPVRDALISVLTGMDYEHDELNTPRIVGVVNKKNQLFSIGIIRIDGIEVKEFKLHAGEYLYISTYNHDHLSDNFRGTDFSIENAEQGCDFIKDKGLFLNLEKPIFFAAAIETMEGFQTFSK